VVANEYGRTEEKEEVSPPVRRSARIRKPGYVPVLKVMQEEMKKHFRERMQRAKLSKVSGRTTKLNLEMPRSASIRKPSRNKAFSKSHPSRMKGKRETSIGSSGSALQPESSTVTAEIPNYNQEKTLQQQGDEDRFHQGKTALKLTRAKMDSGLLSQSSQPTKQGRPSHEKKSSGKLLVKINVQTKKSDGSLSRRRSTRVRRKTSKVSEAMEVDKLLPPRHPVKDRMGDPMAELFAAAGVATCDFNGTNLEHKSENGNRENPKESSSAVRRSTRTRRTPNKWSVNHTGAQNLQFLTTSNNPQQESTPKSIKTSAFPRNLHSRLNSVQESSSPSRRTRFYDTVKNSSEPSMHSKKISKEDSDCAASTLEENTSNTGKKRGRQQIEEDLKALENGSHHGYKRGLRALDDSLQERLRECEAMRQKRLRHTEIMFEAECKAAHDDIELDKETLIYDMRAKLLEQKRQAILKDQGLLVKKNMTTRARRKSEIQKFPRKKKMTVRSMNFALSSEEIQMDLARMFEAASQQFSHEVQSGKDKETKLNRVRG